MVFCWSDMPPLRMSDIRLVRRLEEAEAQGGLACVEADRLRDPRSRAASMAVGGGQALFVAPDSPLNHTLGLGVAGPVESGEIDRMEDFFRRRRSPSLIDLCPHCEAALVEDLSSRGYRILEFNNVMARRVSAEDGRAADAEQALRIRRAVAERRQEWAELMCRGFQLPDELRNIGEILFFNADSRCYFVEIEGQPVATAALAVRGATAAFFADSTLGEARGMGAQTLLIRRRLQVAARAGCDLAMVSVLPGSVSHRNYERAGFEVAYTRSNLIREFS